MILWYDIYVSRHWHCPPPPPKKNKNIVRESGNHRPVISTLMDQEGLLPPVRFGEFTAMYGKSEAKECSGNPGSVHEKTRGTAESNLVTSGRTKWLLGSRSYHNTRIPSWFFGEDVNDCECIYMYLFWGWFGDGWRGTTCVFLKLAYYAWYFTYFGYVLWSSKPTWFVFSLVAQSCWPKEMLVSNMQIAWPLFRATWTWFKEVTQKTSWCLLKPTCWTISWPETHLFYCHQGTPSH